MSEPTSPDRNYETPQADRMNLGKDNTPTTGPMNVPAAPMTPPVASASPNQYQNQPAYNQPDPNYNGYGQPNGYSVPQGYTQGPVQQMDTGWEKHNLPSTYYGLGAAATIIIGLFVGFTFLLTPILSVLAIVFGRKEKQAGKDSLLGVVLGWVTLAISIIPFIFIGIAMFILFLAILA